MATVFNGSIGRDMSTMPTDSHPEDVNLRISGTHQRERALDAHRELSNPLSDAQLNEIRLCSKRAKPIEKAVRYANFSGWATLLSGVV